MSQGSILCIDAYDSFSNNILTLLQEELGVSTVTIKIDDPRFVLNDDAFHSFLQDFDAVIAGPGPGCPSQSQDVGLIAQLWTLPDSALLPTLGICLGFQSLCLAYGAGVHRLHTPRHGLVTPITHQSTGFFRGAREVLATQYHSLHAVLCGEHNEAVFKGDLLPQAWELYNGLVPLAWDISDLGNGPILMAVEHCSKPFSGMQFHPESICTNDEGKRLIHNWWKQVVPWNGLHRKHERPSIKSTARALLAPLSSKPSLVVDRTVDYVELDGPGHITTADLVNLLHLDSQDPHPIVLQSGIRNGRPINPETGRFSIIGMPEIDSVNLRYSCSNKTMTVEARDETMSVDSDVDAAFDLLERYTKKRKVAHGNDSIPFWGGWIGYISYEAGLETIEIDSLEGSSTQPDMWFVFVERSVVIDHVACKAYVQSIKLDDRSWIDKISLTIKRTLDVTSSTAKDDHASDHKYYAQVAQKPERRQYYDAIDACFGHLHAGRSYELCLTAQTTVHSSEDDWAMYERLSRLNPAPFGAYIQFEDVRNKKIGVTLVGSSPERFLSWSRTGQCQFRPIKGTVSKSGGTTKAEAEGVLRSQKEMAENLMIVDLIRHDLAGVKGVHNIRVPTLMAVEEYETVFQLVSVIEGDMTASCSGVDVLAASLPPGSMTGAPKRSSCRILQDLEHHQPRGLYSGVLGYLDIGGGGDFSVVIRTALKWHNEGEWRVGAGGAITALSDRQAEYDEMKVKRQRVLDVLLNIADQPA